MNVVIEEVPSAIPSSANVNFITAANDTIVFYIAHETKWLLDSGCSDHITCDVSDFSEYNHLTMPQNVYLADRMMHISYISIGTVSATTQVNGQIKKVMLRDVLHP